MTSEHTEEPKDDDSACQDTETDWDTSDPDADRVLSVDIKCLCGPEKQNGEEVGSRDKGDNEGEDEDARVLL